MAVADEGWDGTVPFAAAGNGEFQLPDRHRGAVGGARACGRARSVYSNTFGYFLWVWDHPRPEVPISRIELAPGDGSVLVAAITLGNAGERSVPAEAARTVRVTATGAHGPLAEPVVEVDRGVAGYAFRLPDRSVQEYLDDPRRGWGEDADPASSSAYVRIAAVPSATVAVKDGADAVGRFRWGDLTEDGGPPRSRRDPGRGRRAGPQLGPRDGPRRRHRASRCRAACTSARPRAFRTSRTATTTT